MSRFCIALLSSFCGAESLTLCKQILAREAACKKIGLQFELDYEEPFLHECPTFDDSVLCNFSDAQDTINCERLLCNDGCNVDIWPDIGTLDYRISNLMELLQVAQRYASCIEFFIGYSGELYEDFDRMKCPMSMVKDYLVQMINADPFLALHISITEDISNSTAGQNYC